MEKKLKIIKTVPAKGVYFKEDYIDFNNKPENTGRYVVNVYRQVEFQEILGFGGSFTESTAYNYSLLSDEDKARFIKDYFDNKDGIGYNFGRICISSSDFSLGLYSNVEEGDKTLETFNIERDKKYIIPFIKDALKYRNEDIVLFASPWSPPPYMKDNNSYIEGGKLLEEYKSVWALYFAKFIKAYKEEGINISAITVQNEPLAKQTWESCYYTAEDERDFIKYYLAPTLEKEGLSYIKIIIWDHNKERLFERANAVLSDDKVNEKVWAVGHHWYAGEHFEAVRLVNQVLKKPTISTEHCSNFVKGTIDESAENYAKEMIEDLNCGDIAICDWNMLLDTKGGPYHNRTKRVKTVEGAIAYEQTDRGCFAPILLDPETKQMDKTSIFYYIGHITKFAHKGAKVVATTKFSDKIYTVAFKNPDNSYVAVILNTSDEELQVNLRVDNTCSGFEIEPHSIMTILL